MKTTIITKKIGAGHFSVTLIQEAKEIGKFQTTDMQLIDDIQEMNSGGNESELMMHETFDEVIQTCLDHLKNLN